MIIHISLPVTFLNYGVIFLVGNCSSCKPFSVFLSKFVPGESPSSSASDVDNLNNHTTADKVALSKGVSSPQIATNHVIAARNRPNFTRLLGFVSTQTLLESFNFLYIPLTVTKILWIRKSDSF